MKHTIIAAVGEDMDSLFTGIREFETEKVILLCIKEYEHIGLETKKKLDEFKVPNHAIKIKDSLWENIFKEISQITSMEEDKEKLLINASTGTPFIVAAMTSAAFINGIKAFSVEKDEIVILPILKFSYYKMIPDKKMQILKLLYNKTHCCSSLEDLSKEMGMSLPLISYHINGNIKSEGLKEMGLVQTKEKKGKIGVQLSLQGRLMIKGYL